MFCLAERQGFEPWKPCDLRAFQARALDQLCDLSILFLTFTKITYTLYLKEVVISRSYVASEQELDEISDDPNIPSFIRTQIWNIVSLLESRK